MAQMDNLRITSELYIYGHTHERDYVLHIVTTLRLGLISSYVTANEGTLASMFRKLSETSGDYSVALDTHRMSLETALQSYQEWVT